METALSQSIRRIRELRYRPKIIFGLDANSNEIPHLFCAVPLNSLGHQIHALERRFPLRHVHVGQAQDFARAVAELDTNSWEPRNWDWRAGAEVLHYGGEVPFPHIPDPVMVAQPPVFEGISFKTASLNLNSGLICSLV